MDEGEEMKCSGCKKEITQVHVTSKCWQKASVDKKGVMTDYGSIEEIEETISVNCANCGRDVTGKVKP